MRLLLSIICFSWNNKQYTARRLGRTFPVGRRPEFAMILDGINVQTDELADFCRRNGIRKLALFGSALTDRFSETSDIDLLVEFAPEEPVGYLRMAAMERELSNLFCGRKIDLKTPAELSKYFRDDVIRSASVQYAAP
jgi:uncharacterized protein